MAHHFISDLHLSPSSPQLSSGFYHFLNTLNAGESLYILGDLFDAWIGDDEDTEDYLEVQKILREKTDAGIDIYFMHGNRDFAIGKAFSLRTGVQLLKDPWLTTIDGLHFLITHGDSLCTHDKRYMRFRKIIRNPCLLWLLTHLPLTWRRCIATKLRKNSATQNANKQAAIMDVNPKEVERLFATSDIDILLHGHTHRPARHAVEKKERIVLGDWGETAWVLKLHDGQLEFREFELAGDA